MGKPHTEKTLNTIRGKNLVNAVTKNEVYDLFDHIDALEMLLDDIEDDRFGPEGWRHVIGLE